MHTYLLRILELLFPSTEDEKILAATTPAYFAALYKESLKDDVLSLTSFSYIEVRAAMHVNKFHGSKNARMLLAQLLTIYLKKLPSDTYLLIPIPLSKKRERSRGYNQVTIIAEHVVQTKEFKNVALATNILMRNRDTKPQASLSKEERLTNLEGAFVVQSEKSKLITGKRIILLDDVTTTGRTLHEAKAQLLLHDPLSITCVALAS